MSVPTDSTGPVIDDVVVVGGGVGSVPGGIDVVVVVEPAFVEVVVVETVDVVVEAIVVVVVGGALGGAAGGATGAARGLVPPHESITDPGVQFSASRVRGPE